MLRFECRKIASVRREKGLTQAQLADIMGRYRQQVDQWERGGRTPSAENLALIATALGVGVENFFVCK